MGESPSSILSRAADLIRDMAAAATAGPWRRHDTWLNIGGHTATVLADAQPKIPLVAWLPTMEADPHGQERRVWQNAAWIALLNPAVAPALERALRHEAGLHRLFTERGDPFYGPSPLLEFARVILGEEEDDAEAS